MDRHIQENKFRHVLLDEFEMGIAAEVGDVVHRTGDKIVDGDDLVAAREQQVRQVRAQKSGAAGDDGSGLRDRRRRFFLTGINCQR